jgi:predicted nucleic acid-binding protein
MNAVDTNVLLYSLDASEPTKRPIAQALLRDLRTSSEKTVLPW